MFSLLAPMGDLFIPQPWLALIPAAIFLLMWIFGKSPWALIAGIFWLLYTALETLNLYRITCSGDCNIRIDLLAIYPTLVLISILGLIGAFLKWARKPI